MGKTHDTPPNVAVYCGSYLALFLRSRSVGSPSVTASYDLKAIGFEPLAGSDSGSFPGKTYASVSENIEKSIEDFHVSASPYVLTEMGKIHMYSQCAARKAGVDVKLTATFHDNVVVNLKSGNETIQKLIMYHAFLEGKKDGSGGLRSGSLELDITIVNTGSAKKPKNITTKMTFADSWGISLIEPHKTPPVELNLNHGDRLTIAANQELTVWIQSPDAGYVYDLADFGNTTHLFIDPLDADVSLVAESGHDYRAPRFPLVLAADGDGTVTAQPVLETYPMGTTVTVTADPAGGSQFLNWTGNVPAGHEQDNPLSFAITTDTLLTAHFTEDPAALPAPAGLSATAGEYSYKVETAWDAVTSATHYRLWRSVEGETHQVDLTGWQTATSFQDDSAMPGVHYQYWVQAAANAMGLHGSQLSDPVTGWVAGSLAEEKVYRVTYRDCQIQTDTPETSDLLFTGVGPKASVKIAWMKKGMPANASNKPGTHYITVGTIPLVRVEGGLTSFYSDAPVARLEVTGEIKRLTANDEIRVVEAGGLGSARLSAQRNALALPAQYAWTSIETAQSATAMSLQASGVLIKSFEANQPVKLISVGTKKYVDPATRTKRLSLGGLGSVERVVEDVWGNGTAPEEEGDAVIHAVSIARIRTSGAPIVCGRDPGSHVFNRGGQYDVQYGDRPSVTAQGNIRVPRIKSQAALKHPHRPGGKTERGTLTVCVTSGTRVRLGPPRLVPGGQGDRGTIGRVGCVRGGYQEPNGKPAIHRLDPEYTRPARCPGGRSATSRPKRPPSSSNPAQGEFLVQTEPEIKSEGIR
jgi:hypothetical protein